MRPVPPAEFDLARCLAISDVVVSAVPSATYKIPTAALKDGCVCVNVAADKNFEADVRDKVRRTTTYYYFSSFFFWANLTCVCVLLFLLQASFYIPAVGKVTILMLLRNL